MNRQPKHRQRGRNWRPRLPHYPRHSLTPFWKRLAIGIVVVLSLGFILFVWPAEAHEINCGSEPSRKQVRQEIESKLKPLKLKIRPGDVFNRGALEDLWDRAQERARRVKEWVTRRFQKVMIRWDRCTFRAYNHQEWHEAQQFTPFGEWAIPGWCVEAESGGENIESASPYSSASGYYMFLDSTWANFKGYARAIFAPKAVQDEKAHYTYEAQGIYPWHACW